ncbi:hypothetical protein FRX31_020893 [Thalictrum thalictroides]|uniref:Uncharacterized protein n=1 Tax=Thalictrum thalictroides TaxID=46969 RepID=A0A7J6VWN2_THATH|nr:hypothetical protein FRX31_020893 [Thalictrum thalictroides]
MFMLQGNPRLLILHVDTSDHPSSEPSPSYKLDNTMSDEKEHEVAPMIIHHRQIRKISFRM